MVSGHPTFPVRAFLPDRRPFTRSGNLHRHGRYLGQRGFIVNPMAATIFFGLVMIVVVYSALDLTGRWTSLGPYGPLLPLLIIFWLLVGVHQGIKRLKRRAARIRIKGPLFMRTLMNDCLQRTCGQLDRRLNTPETTSVEILNDILTDKVLQICRADCLRFSDIRRQIEAGRLKGTADLELAAFFQAAVEYGRQELPGEIRQVADTVARSRPDLKGSLERLENAHRRLCTGPGNILSLLPPDAKKADRIRSAYRYRPPAPERAQRMAFALETLTYLKATRHENVNPLDRKRYDSVAAQAIPQLAEALKGYRRAWQNLADAYEKPESERSR